MAQFDVHRTSGAHPNTIPYIVVVQPALFDEYSRRVVVPLVKASAVGARWTSCYRGLGADAHGANLTAQSKAQLAPIT
jgi:hypothetical protein